MHNHDRTLDIVQSTIVRVQSGIKKIIEPEERKERRTRATMADLTLASIDDEELRVRPALPGKDLKLLHP